MKVMRSKPKKIWLVIVVLVVLITISVVVLFLNRNNSNSDRETVSNDTNSDTKSNIEPPPRRIHIAAMGDMLAHDTITLNAKTNAGYDYSKYFNNIRTVYSDADVVFCNQEGPSAGGQYGISGYPSFNAPTQFAADLQNGAGCNLINLANNHIADKGAGAIDATINVWAGLKPLAVNGANRSVADQEKVSYTTVNGIKIGFVAFADFSNNKTVPGYSVNLYHNEALVRRLVAKARRSADAVIISMHWGIEDSSSISLDQQNQVKLLASLGADVVIGTGPHVLQEVKTINRSDGGKMLVWYSLGNMLSSQLDIKELIGGIAEFDIAKTSDNKITIDTPTFTPTYMHYEWTSQQAASGDLLARKNVMIYTLNSANEPLSRSLFKTTVANQKQYVVNTLGREVRVK